MKFGNLIKIIACDRNNFIAFRSFGLITVVNQNFCHIPGGAQHPLGPENP